MSELSSKLEWPASTHGTKARATLAQLRNRWGELLEEREGLVRLTSMGGPEWWRRVSGRGESALYEREK